MYSTPNPRRLFLLLIVLAIWVALQTAISLPTNISARLISSSPIDPPPNQQFNTNIFHSSSVPPTLVEIKTESLVTNHAVPDYQINGDLTLINSFKAIDHTQSQEGAPPNPAIMVGRDHVVVSVNSSFQIFDKDGIPLTTPNRFIDLWNGSCGTGSDMALFFPFSTYDEQAGRYVMGVAGNDSTIDNGNNSYLCIAVSQTDSAIGQWNLYNFDANPDQGNDYYLEFPRVGTGQQALFLGAAIIDTESYNFITNRVFAFEKEAMYNGTSAAFLHFDIGDPYFGIIPADLKGYNTGNWPADPNEPHYFMDADSDQRDEVRVFAFEDPWGTPSFNLIGSVPVSSYRLPVDQPQAGTGSYILGFDNRLTNVAYLNGRLWTNHTIGCGQIISPVNCIRWYEIDLVNGLTPALVQEGTFGSSSDFRSFPGLALNNCGDMLVGYTKTSSASFPGVFVAGREQNDAPGQLKSETELHDGETFYISEEGQPYRWGYYTGMTIDPDGQTLWYLGEYSRLQPVSRWSTWVGAFTWSDCGTGPTPTPTTTQTPTATATQSPTTTPSPSHTTTMTPMATSTQTPTSTPTHIPTSTPSPSPTATGTTTYRNWIPIMMN